MSVKHAGQPVERAEVVVSVPFTVCPTSIRNLPGQCCTHQVNAVIPKGVPAGDTVPVVMTVAAQSSPIATIAIR